MKDTDDITRKKFRDPFYTLDGSQRASVPFERMKTLWFNTGTLCNIECANCYIKSSPTNDDLIYLTHKMMLHTIWRKWIAFTSALRKLGLQVANHL